MIPLYDYAKMHTVKASGITDIGTVFEQVVTMTTPVLEAGTYMIGFAAEANYHGQKNQPAELQLTGTFAGEIYSESIGDNDQGIKTSYYSFPKVWGGGAITLGVQVRKSASFLEALDVNFVDVMVYRVA